MIFSFDNQCFSHAMLMDGATGGLGTVSPHDLLRPFLAAKDKIMPMLQQMTERQNVNAGALHFEESCGIIFSQTCIP